VPFTWSVKPERLHDGIEFDEVPETTKEEMVGATIVNEISADVPPPGPGVNTFT
jgi:hypothetical protein